MRKEQKSQVQTLILVIGFRDPCSRDELARQLENEGCSLCNSLAFGTQSTPMSYDGRFRNRQPKTQTSKLTCDFLTTLSERIKNCRQSLRLNSNAGVRNLDENQAHLVARAYTDLAAFLGEL